MGFSMHVESINRGLEFQLLDLGRRYVFEATSSKGSPLNYRKLAIMQKSARYLAYELLEGMDAGSKPIISPVGFNEVNINGRGQNNHFCTTLNAVCGAVSKLDWTGMQNRNIAKIAARAVKTAMLIAYVFATDRINMKCDRRLR